MGRSIARIMRVGLAISTAFWLFGLTLFGVTGTPVDFTNGTSLPLGDLPQALASLDPLAYLLIGFVVLLATPITRVVASLLEFEHQGDSDYVILTSIVLGILVVIIIIGLVT